MAKLMQKGTGCKYILFFSMALALVSYSAQYAVMMPSYIMNEIQDSILNNTHAAYFSDKMSNNAAQESLRIWFHCVYRRGSTS